MPSCLVRGCFVSVLFSLVALALALARGAQRGAAVAVDTVEASTVLKATQRSTNRQLGARSDLVTDLVTLAVNRVINDMVEKDEIRRAYYRRAMRQLYDEHYSSSTVNWATIEEEDGELEEMKRQKDEKNQG